MLRAPATRGCRRAGAEHGCAGRAGAKAGYEVFDVFSPRTSSSTRSCPRGRSATACSSGTGPAARRARRAPRDRPAGDRSSRDLRSHHPEKHRDGRRSRRLVQRSSRRDARARRRVGLREVDTRPDADLGLHRANRRDDRVRREQAMRASAGRRCGEARDMQIIFQDSGWVARPAHARRGRSSAKALSSTGHRARKERRARVVELLERVGLAPAAGRRYPHQFAVASASGSASPGRSCCARS